MKAQRIIIRVAWLFDYMIVIMLNPVSVVLLIQHVLTQERGWEVA